MINMISTKQIYSRICDDFDRSRTKMWPCVRRFLSIPTCKNVLDIGCGNGKNMIFPDIPDITFKGVDFCPEFVDICRKKGLDVTEADMTSLPFPDENFDGVMAIASYHHLDNDTDRRKALREMYRVLKKDGVGIIVVWAKEQDGDSRFVFDSGVKTSAFGWDEYVEWKLKKEDGYESYKRYYHVYEKGDLENEITMLCPEFYVVSVDWEKGNWIALLRK